MWVCLKTGLQSDLKFIIPPISSSDDWEGSWLLVSWSSRWFPVLSTSKEAGKECGCVCLKGDREVSPTSLNAGTQVSGVACQGPQHYCEFKHPCLMIQFLSFNQKCREDMKEGSESTAVLSCLLLLGQHPQGPSSICHMPGAWSCPGGGIKRVTYNAKHLMTNNELTR